MVEDIIRRYGERVGYTKKDLEKFYEVGHRIRHLKRLSEAASRYSIEAEVVKARHCNSSVDRTVKQC